MEKKRNIVEWATHYRQIVILVTCCLVAFGIYMNGEGTLKTVAGMQYKGGFVDGLEEGQGVQIDKDGNRFDGFFKQGKKNGPFVETDKDGKIIRKGTYKFGRLQ